MTFNWDDGASVGFTVALAMASYRASQRFADLAEISNHWWLCGWEYWLDPGLYTVVGTGILAVTSVPLINGVRRRSHARVALTGLVSASLVYAALLQIWSEKPGPIVDSRPRLTMSMSLVPLYAAVLSAGAHVLIAILGPARTPSD